MQSKDLLFIYLFILHNLVSYVQTLAVDGQQQHIVREEDHQSLLKSLQEQLFEGLC